MEGALRIHNMVGSVVVHGWDKDTVLVRGTISAGDNFFMGGGYTGAKMFVESANERDPKPSRLEVWVPARVRLWVKTATANIDVSDVAGGLDLYVVSGTIDVTGNPHELNAEAIDGDIHITGSPSWLRAKSATGAITLQGASADAGLSTVSGPIRIDGGAGGILVRIADRVAGHRRLVSVGALAAVVAVLDVFLGVVPRTAAGGHGYRHENAGDDGAH